MLADRSAKPFRFYLCLKCRQCQISSRELNNISSLYFFVVGFLNTKTSFPLFHKQLIQEGLRDTLDAYFGLIQVSRKAVLRSVLKVSSKVFLLNKREFRVYPYALFSSRPNVFITKSWPLLLQS